LPKDDSKALVNKGFLKKKAQMVEMERGTLSLNPKIYKEEKKQIRGGHTRLKS